MATWSARRAATVGVAAAVLAAPLVAEMRLARPTRPLTNRWQGIPVEPRGSTRLGLSFRSPQVDSLGLNSRETLRTLLAYPFHLIRLAAYWSRLEPAAGQFQPAELDWQVDAAERAGKQIILCVGALKAFGYPEFFVPPHHLPRPLREGRLVQPSDHPSLLAAATAFLTRVVERYRDRPSVVAWQVEHEAVDPLGMEHSWRLATPFVEREIAAVRAADPTRPILLNGYLPTSLLVGLQQGWRTRDQGDSLAVAERLADIVGLDCYPRHAVVGLGPWTVYLDGSRGVWPRRRRHQILRRARATGTRLMVTEGQAEPWEAVTTPPNPPGRGMLSCLPEQVIVNYNQWLQSARQANAHLDAYLFWGAEYWVLRQQSADPRYLGAFARILEQAG